jgi:hypothetical protein
MRLSSWSRVWLGLAMMLLVFVVTGTGTAAASVAWTVRSLAQPSRFLPAGPDRYEILVSNTGGKESSEPPTVTDRLPKGLTMASTMGEGWGCSPSEASPEQWVVTCSFEESIGAMRYTQPLFIEVSPPGVAPGVLQNEVGVTGGGATVSDRLTESTEVGTVPPGFGLTEFNIEAHTETGEESSQAGGHPWEFTTSFGIPWVQTQSGAVEEPFVPVENLKKVVVELPLGMSGNPFAAEQCIQAQLKGNHCPAHSRVGTIAIAAGFLPQAEYRYTGGPPGVSGLFDMKTERGYPAEFGFTAYEQVIYLYATVVHSSDGERLRLTTIGAPPHAEAGNVEVTVWGEPGALNGSGSTQALLTNPVNCTSSGKARIEINSWAQPEHVIAEETPVFTGLTGCPVLQPSFTPELEVKPTSGEGTTRADSPFGLSDAVGLPQTTGFGEAATAEIKDVSATLPPGVSINSAAAQGLVGCKERGPEGINLGTSSIGPAGRDEGDPEATELGAGHAGGNNSLYNDDQYHTAPGHCPAASTVGTVEVVSPVVAEPLIGHLFLAQPKCGVEGLRACVEGDTENGTLFAGYVELAGDGVLVKEKGTLSVNPANGQITLHVNELPQFPFSSLKLTVNGGSRAPLATPQACGSASTASSFTPWSSNEAVAPTSAFTVDADGAGGACPATWPFTPGFAAESLSPVAAVGTVFTTTLTRQDREQNPTGLSVGTPFGLLGNIASVTPCPEPQAASGECPETSLIGHDTAGAGAGPEPFYVHGKVYLTGPYKGAPFGLSVVTPAAAGPFNLGNIVTRATITVDRATAAVSITSDPIPQFRFGVPLRLKALNVTIDREGFLFNPTNCRAQQVTAMITGNQGATSNQAVPFAVTGCAVLPFAPKFSVSTSGKTSKANGASLTAKLVFPPRSQKAEADIRSVKVTLPKALPARLTTLQKACTEKQFASNPAGCPAGSFVGVAVAHTEILRSPLVGPAILVSHGGLAFPDLVVVLQAEGVTIELTGNTSIKKNVTTSTFASVPDAPVETFELVLPEGPHSALAANGNLCTQKLVMPTEFVAQNNATMYQNTAISVAGCPPSKPTVKIKKAKLEGNTLLVTLTTSQKGAVSLSGNGLKTLKKTLTAGTHQLKLTLTKNGRAARKRHSKTKLKATIKTHTGTATTTKTLKL